MMYYTRATIRIPSPSTQFTDAVQICLFMYTGPPLSATMKCQMEVLQDPFYFWALKRTPEVMRVFG